MLKRIGHIIMIPLLLVATIGMTINLHYCHHKLYDIGVFREAKSCCAPGANAHQMEMAVHCHAVTPEKTHCEDETISVESVDDFVSLSYNFSFDQLALCQLFASAPIISDLAWNSAPKAENIPTLGISPPGTKHILAVLQTYLI